MGDLRHYVCAACGCEYRADFGEAIAEATATFTSTELSDSAVVCDDCWRDMRRTMPDFDARYINV